MPAMPRPSKSKKISDRIMRNNNVEPSPKEKARKVNGETKFDREVRTMIKR